MNSTATSARTVSRTGRDGGTANDVPDHPHGPAGEYDRSSTGPALGLASRTSRHDAGRTSPASTRVSASNARPTQAEAEAKAEAASAPAPSAGPTPTHPRPHSRRRFLLGAGAAVGLGVAGTAAWALNRFVIDHVAISDIAAYEAAHASAVTDGTSTGTTQLADPSAATLTDTTYTSPTSSATLTQHTSGSGADTVTWYTAELTLADPTALRSAFARNEFGTNITAKPSTIAAEQGAALAVNGDYYGFRTDGILIRNGVIYRDSPARAGLVLYTDGRMVAYDETATSAQALLDGGAWQTLSFGPPLVTDGQVVDGIDAVEVDTNVGNHSIQGNQPRTAVGMIDPGRYLLMVVDGRSKGYSRGVTLPELAQMMLDAGATTAYNLDGGGSSALYWNGRIVNQPSNGGERATSDILYLATGA